MDTIQVENLHKDLSFTGDLLIDSSFLLLPQSTPVTQELVNALNKWEFSSVLCDGGLSLGGDIGVSSHNDDSDNQSKKELGVNLKRAIESSKQTKIGNSDKARMEMVQAVFDEYMNYIEDVFTHYATHKEIDQHELSDTVQELVMFIKDHKRYILRINPDPDECKKNFLVIHSMRTTILSIAIAQQLHLPLSKIIELGVTCIIHEIGMLRIPSQLYMTQKNLTFGERAQMSKHTLHGYTIVKDLNFPLSIQLGVLEHHEKENGTGYPRKMTGDKISSNAKIIAVACSYEAISSPRGYKAERSTFDAMIELIQNKNHSYDDAVLKALLYTVSLYPIGTYVYLSNRKVALVCDTNPDNPKYPIVQLLIDKEADGSPVLIPTDPNGISIIRILSKAELTDIKALIEAKENALNGITETEPAAPTPEQVSAPETAAESTEAPVEEISEVEDIESFTPSESSAIEPQEPVTEAPKPAAKPAPKAQDDVTEEIDISFFE